MSPFTITFLVGCLAGIFLWQIVMVVMYNLDITDDTRDAISCFIVLPFVLLLRWALNKWLLFRLRKYNYYQFFGSTASYDSWVGNYWMTPEFASQFNLIEPVNSQVSNPPPPSESYCVRYLRSMAGRKEPPWKADIFNESHTPNIFKDENFLNKFKKRA